MGGSLLGILGSSAWVRVQSPLGLICAGFSCGIRWCLRGDVLNSRVERPTQGGKRVETMGRARWTIPMAIG